MFIVISLWLATELDRSSREYCCICRYHNPEVVFISITWRTGQEGVDSEDYPDSADGDDEDDDDDEYDDAPGKAGKTRDKRRTKNRVKKRSEKTCKGKATASGAKGGGRGTSMTSSASRKNTNGFPDKAKKDTQKKKESFETAINEDEYADEVLPDSVEELKELLKQKNIMLKKAWKMASQVSRITYWPPYLDLRSVWQLVQIIGGLLRDLRVHVHTYLQIGNWPVFIVNPL